MRWFLIDKSATTSPEGGTYRSWKPALRTEGRYQCVYCAIGEPLFGGERNFHVEHYRPRKVFPLLTNDFANLFYCCSICNSFKGSDWQDCPPNDLSCKVYPNPSTVDYATFLLVDDGGFVSSSLPAGRYIIERLNLNRAQLRMIRRFVILRDQITDLLNQVEINLRDCQDPEILKLALSCMSDAYRVVEQFTRANPYEPADARR